MRRSNLFLKIPAGIFLWLCVFPGTGGAIAAAQGPVAQGPVLATSDVSSDAAFDAMGISEADLPDAVFAEPDSGAAPDGVVNPDGLMPDAAVDGKPMAAGRLRTASSAPEFRVISTRSGTPQWLVRGDDGRFRRTDESAFRETTDPTLPLVILVHGNQTSSDRALDMGCELYRFLCAGKTPFRLVLWSWKADRECLSVRMDSRLNAARADAEAIPLAGFIASQPAESPVILVGYSFGCRTIGGAAQLCAGGRWLGKRLATTSTGAVETLESSRPATSDADAFRTVLRPINAAIFIAAAMDDTNFQPDGGMGAALDAIERSLVTVNPCDQALALYPMISDSCRSAMGLAGPTGVSATQADRVRLMDVSREAGPLHLWESYFPGSRLGHRITAAIREAATAT